MTRVCVRCGWLVLRGERCTRDSGPSIKWQTAAQACQVRTLHELLHLSPVARVIGFAEARGRLLGDLELGRGTATADRPAT